MILYHYTERVIERGRDRHREREREGESKGVKVDGVKNPGRYK